MSVFPRADKHLTEPINHLEQIHIDCEYDDKKAWGRLGNAELSFVIQEVARCYFDIVYYLKNYHFIRRKEEAITTLFPLWESQVVFLEAYKKQYEENKPIRLLVLKSRQQGITTLSTAVLCHMVFFNQNRRVLSMSDEYDKTAENYKMAITAYNLLPWWLRPGKHYERVDELLSFDRVKKGETEGLDSCIMYDSANKPTGAAYSKALFGAHLAEVGRYRHAKPITEGVFGSLVGMPHSVGIFEGTAQGRGTLFHGLWKKAMSGAFAWEPIFIEWFKEPTYRIVPVPGFELTSNEIALKSKIKETTGYEIEDDQFQWYRNKRAEFAAAGDEARLSQEFPSDHNEAWVASGDTVFPKEKLLEQLTNFVRKPRWRGIITLKENDKPKLIPDKEGELSIWEFPKPGEQYVIGGDPSLGLDTGDLGGIHVLIVPKSPNDPLRQCAVMHGRITPHEFARSMAGLGYIYNTALIAPEVNQINSIAVDLMNTFSYPNIYRMSNQTTHRGYAPYFGWMTTHRNKNAMIGRLRELLLRWDIIIKDDKTINELLEFVRKDTYSGQYGPQTRDGHDDLVMSLCITAYIASNLNPEMLYADDEMPQAMQSYQVYESDETGEASDYQSHDDLPSFDEL